MTKKEFIWLAIRFLGLAILIVSFEQILMAIAYMLTMIHVFPPAESSETYILMVLFGSFISSLIPIAAGLYLLFFGKSLFTLIHRSSDSILNQPSEKTNMAELAIRFVSVIWLYKLFKQVLSLAWYFTWFHLFSTPRWPFKFPIDEELRKAMSEKLFAPMLDQTLWVSLIYLATYTFLAWYFLRRGKLFISLLNRIWLNKVKEAKPLTADL